MIIQMPESIRSDNLAALSLSDQTRVFIPILESLRDLLARRLVQDCHAITDHDLNYTILSSILQVLFLRTGQDCGFAEPGTLTLLARSDGISRRMARACSDAGLSPDILFEKGQDGPLPVPDVPDDALREVIRCMDSEKFPVPLSTLPIGQLAVIFEHFLGTRMQVAEGYHVKRSGKSAVLYTGSVGVPLQAVVEYVVNKAMSDAIGEPETGGGAGIRILDPACGAGIFLLAAFQALVRRKAEPPCRPGQRGELLQDLVCQTIYGTDIDPEYVSMARFILLLSFIEECRLSGYGHDSPDRLQEISECLKSTIRCGNALIAKDYFSGLQEHPFNAEERRRVNAFSWQEAFPHVFNSGGFDAVIGAPPPYQPFTIKARDEYFQTHYDVYAKGAGLYSYFIEKGLKVLRPKGSLAFCIPNTFLRTNHARSVRKFLLTKQIEEIVDFGDLPVFKTAATYPCIILVSNNKPSHEFCVSKVETLEFPSLNEYVKEHRHPVDQRILSDGGWTLSDKRTENLLKKLQSRGTPLEEYVMGAVHYGIKTGQNKAFVIDECTKKKLIEEDPKSAGLIKRFLAGKDIKRYHPVKSEKFLIFLPKGWTNLHSGKMKNKWKWLMDKYPAIARHLEPFSEDGQKRSDKGDYWWEISECDRYPEFEKPKIVYPEICQKPEFTLDDSKFYVDNKCFIIPGDDKFLLGILNSTLTYFLFETNLPEHQPGFFIPAYAVLKNFPIYTPDFDKPDDKARHHRMVMLVTEMLDLHKHLSHAKTDREKRIIKQEIESTDRQIDSLVYGLYGLTADEIKIIEECVGK
jgi:hypothetical protein